MDVDANLTEAKLVGSIKGTIVSIEVDTEIDGSALVQWRDTNGIPIRYKIVIEDSNTRNNIVCYITGKEFLHKSIDRLGLTSEIKFKLRNGEESLSLADKQAIKGMELYVTAVADEYKNQSAVPILRRFITDIQLLKKNDAYYGDEVVYNAGVAENWPEPDTPLPFVPIKVPMQGPHSTRIGYAVFDNPINFIATTRSTQIDQIPAMRLPGTIKKGTGKAYESYTITYVAQGALEIEKSVKEVFEQISLTPFTSVEGGPFGVLGGDEEERAIRPQAIAVRNFSLSTLEGYPGAVQVEISFDPFNWDFYVPLSDNDDNPVFNYDDLICWPLVKCWAKRAEKSNYSGTDFNGKFALYYPTKAGADIANLISLTNDNLDIGTDYATLSSFSNILSSEKGGRDVTSRNIKEILNPAIANFRTFIVKVKSRELFDKYINLPNFWGLTVWDKYSASNFVDHQGNFLPESALIDDKYFTNTVPGTAFQQYEGVQAGISTVLNRYIEIPKSNIVFGASGAYSVGDAIESFFAGVGNRSTTEVLDAKENPQHTFALVMFSDNDNAPISNLQDLTNQEVFRAAREDINFFQSKNVQIKDVMSNSYIGKNAKNYINGRALRDNVPTTSLPALEVGIGGVDEDVVIERIGASRGHNLAVFSQRGDPLPVHQYMGGMDATFIVQGKCFGNAAKRKLERIKEEFDQRAISKKSTAMNLSPDLAKQDEEPSSGFLFVDNEIFSLLGVNFIMPVTLQFETLDQQPGVWNFTFSFIEYNFELKAAEEVRFLPTSWQKLGKILNYGWGSLQNDNPIIDKAIEYFNLQAELAKEEIYPDLNLPTVGELAFWIQAIYKGASNYYENNGKEYTQALTENEAYIVNMVADQFFPSEAKTIKSKWQPHLSRRVGDESGAFAEPDFYVFYNPDDSFANIFDGITEHQLGVGPQHKVKNLNSKDPSERTNKNNKTEETKKNPFAATGRPGGIEDPTKLPTSGYREYDPNYNVTAVFPTEMYAVNGVKYPIGLMREKVYNENLMPPENAELAKEQINASKQTLDEDPQAWWTKLEAKYAMSTFKEGEKLFYIGDKQVASMAEVYSFTSDTLNKANLVPLQEGTANPFNKATNDTGRYFTIDWRQSFTKKVAGSIATPYPVDEFKTKLATYAGQNTKFFFNTQNDLLADGQNDDFSMQDIENMIIFDIYANDKPSKQQEKVELAKKIITGALIAFNPAAKAAAMFITAGAAIYENYIKKFAVADNAWTTRCANLNAYWGSIEKLSPTVVDRTIPTWEKTGIEGIIETWDSFDRLGKAYEFDPHVLRAFFLRRDGFGKYKPSASVDTGFGDISVEGTKESVVVFVAKLYNAYAKAFYNIPSLALLCVNIRTLSQCAAYRTNNGDIKPEVFENIKRMADTCKNKRFSQSSVDAIAKILNQYPEAGNSIDQYYAAYISLCRTFGVYDSLPDMDRWRDPFFHAYNLLNLIDTDTNDQTVVSKFCPTKNSIGVAIRMNRGEGGGIEIDPFAKDIYEGYDKNNSSVDQDAALSKKMQGTLDPHSETSIYGSMVDLRTHAPVGKLRGAFPSFQVLLINEGFYWNGGSKKLWDQFYTRTGVASIEVFRTRHKPGATASVTFSNMFHNLTNYALMEAIAHESAVKNHNILGDVIKSFNPIKYFGMLGEMWNMLVVKNVPEDARKIWQNNQLKKLALAAGTRLQIRMGYGSNAARLPVVFNGTVVDVPVSEGYVNVTAVSDGAELEKPCTTKLVNAGSSYAFQDGGKVMGAGADPSLIIKHALIAASWFENITGGNFRDHSSGIAHFGETIYSGALRYTAEVEFNIYAARRTKIEQGIGELSAYSFINSVVNWDNERNLFSVSVQQPTPWKVMEVCRRACSDFVAAAEPFALRSTVFFGKWWWPYHFTYNETILRAVLFNEDQSNNKLVATNKAFKQTNSGLRNKDGTPTLLGAFSTSRGSVRTTSAVDQSITFYWHFSDNVVYYAKVEDSSYSEVDLVTEVGTISHKDAKALSQARGSGVGIKDVDEYTQDEIRDVNNGNPTLYISNYRKLYEQYIQRKDTKRVSYKQFLNEGKQEFKWIRMGDSLNENYFKLTDEEEKKGLRLVSWKNDNAPEANSTTVNFAQNVNTIYDSLRDVNQLQIHLRWKPYTQVYFAHSAINLLDNAIRADASRVVTDAIGMHQYNGWISAPSVSKTMAFSVDTDIHASDRKTMMVDTGIMLTGLQAGMDSIAGGITGLGAKIPFIGGGFDTLNQYIEEAPTTPAIENSVISSLVDQVKEMYQGWFTIQGLATVKPKDIFYFNDHVLDMKGPVFVKEVIHKMDTQTGFITMVSPDAVVLPHDSVIGAQMVTSLLTGPMHRITSFYMMKMVAAGFAQHYKNKFLYSKGGGELSKSFRQYKNYEKRLKELAMDVDEQNTAIKHLRELRNTSDKLRILQQGNNLNPEEIKKLVALRAKIDDTIDAVNKNFSSDLSLPRLYEVLRELNDLKKSAPAGSALEKVINKINLDFTDVAVSSKSGKAAKLRSDLIKFEEELQEKIDKYKEELKKGRGTGAVSTIWTDKEIDDAVARFADEERAGFFQDNAKKFEELGLKKTKTLDEVDKLKKLHKNYEKLKKANLYTLGGVDSQNLADAQKEFEDQLKKVNKLVDDYDIVYDNLDDLDLDRNLRKLIKVSGVVWTDSQYKNPLRAAWEARVGTTKAVYKGTLQLGKAAIQEIKDNWAIKKEGVKILGDKKQWLLPSSVVKWQVDAKKEADAIRKEAELAGETAANLEQNINMAAGFLDFNRDKHAKKVTEETTEALKKAARMRKLEKMKKSMETAMLAVRMVKYMGPQAIFSVAFDTTVGIVGGSLIEGYKAHLRARQVVKIIPLRVGKVEFVAGIRGHEGAVIGDNPSWVDEVIGGLHGAPNNVLPTWATNSLGFVAAFNDLEYPQAHTEVDAAYIKAIRDEDEGNEESQGD